MKFVISVMGGHFDTRRGRQESKLRRWLPQRRRDCRLHKERGLIVQTSCCSYERTGLCCVFTNRLIFRVFLCPVGCSSQAAPYNRQAIITSLLCFVSLLSSVALVRSMGLIYELINVQDVFGTLSVLMN